MSSVIPDAPTVRRTRGQILPFPPNSSRARDITIIVTVIAVAMLGLDRHLLIAGFTTGTAAVVALSPVWISTLREFRFAPFLMIFGGIALAWGAVLHEFNGDRSFKMSLAIEIALLFITGVGGVGLLLWARTVIPLHWVVIIFGLAYLVGVAQAVPGSANPWKYLVSVPLTMVLLAAASRAPGVGLTILTLGFIGLVSIAFDSRSYFGFCLLSIVLVLFQTRRKTGRKASKLATVSLIVIALVGLYLAVSTLLVQGYLGAEAQARTVAQTEEGGSLLVSGRPEWVGTWELMKENPMGFGLGTLPSSDDVFAAKEGMVSIGLSPDDGYIENFMFGGHIKLHSIVADFWASFGVVGLAFGLTIICVIGFCLLEHLSNRTASGLICMVSIIAIWDMAFGPIHTNLRDVMLALAVVLPTAAGVTAIGGKLPPDRNRIRVTSQAPNP